MTEPNPAKPSRRIGFCCTYVSPQGDADETRRMNMRTVTMAWLARQPPAEAFARLHEIVAHNLDALDSQIAYVACLPPLERMFRILSGIFPGWSHASAAHFYADADFRALIERRLAAAGAAARASDVRLSMHPGPHAILATRRPVVLTNAIRDMMEHVAIFEMLGYGGGWHPHGAHINIHGGAASAGIDGLRAGLDRLPAAARDLVTIENDENCFGLDDLLPLAGEVALVVDFHHHWIHSRGEYLEPDDPRVAALAASWRGTRPAAHISVSRETVIPGHADCRLPDFGALAAAGLKPGALRGHSDMMWNLAVNDFVARHLAWCDIEVEAKSKNLASAQLAAHVRVADH